MVSTKRLIVLGGVGLLLLGSCARSQVELEPSPTAQAGRNLIAAEDPAAGETPSPSLKEGTTTPAPAPTPTSFFLWEVADKDNRELGFLFGTIHMGVQAPPRIMDRVVSASRVVLEADLRSMVNPLAIMQMATLPDDQCLEKMLGPKAWTLLVDKLNGQVPEEALKRFKPWVVSSLITADLMPASIPMDLEILLQADAHPQVELAFLETLEEQVLMLDEAIGDAELSEMLLDLDSVGEQLNELLHLYVNADLDQFEEYFLDITEAKQYELLFHNRNVAWVEQLVPIFNEGNAFVAVGLGHMLGKDGLPSLLRQKGYTVTLISGPFD